jgi:hypothetical protein
MSDRTWFFAANGQQQGPYPEAQFRDLIARGAVTAQTLVWGEGMPDWQKAGDVPGLMADVVAPPPMARRDGAAMGTSANSGSGSDVGAALSADLPIWPFLGYCVLLVIGNIVVFPSPWTATAYYRWLAPRIHVPGRPNIAFFGRVDEIWYVIITLALTGYIGLVSDKLQYVVIPVQAALSWMLLRWVVSSLASNGRQLPITFKGSIWGYIGFHLLSFIAFFTIIGWAWVVTAWMRWICHNLDGTRREVVFNGTGLQVLWRTIVFVLLIFLIIPIPWVLRWYATWFVSQFALVERDTYASL